MKKLSVVLIILAVAIVGYVAVKIGSGGELSDWNSYTHEGSAEFSFNYPSEWNEPQKNELETRERLIFNEGLVIEAGDFYSPEVERNLTAEESVENDMAVNPGEPERKEIQVAGIDAEKVSFTIPAGSLGTQEGNPIPPEPINITDVFLQQSSSSPVIFLRYSNNDEKLLSRILESFQLVD